MTSSFPLPTPLFRGGLDPMCPRPAVAEPCQRLGAHELQAFRGVVAMDFLDIELPHEVDGFLGDDLSWHHDREAGWIRDDEVRRDQVGAALEPAIDLRIVQAD